jgi:Xaa-Pro aminopeptidase
VRTTIVGAAATLIWAAIMAATGTGSDAAASYGIPHVREQAAEKLSIVRRKLERLPEAMRAHGFDMWIVIDRENHEDPLHDEVGGGYSGVRGAYVFFDRGAGGIEKIFLGSHEQPKTNIVPQLFDSTRYYGYSSDGLTPLLAEVIRDRKPRKIGVNTSLTLPEADGLSVGMRDFLIRALGSDYTPRMASAELLVRDFRTRRVREERELFTRLVAWTDRWMREGFAAVVPGRTTAADMNWWLEQRARDIGLRVGASGSNVPRIVRRGEQLPLASADSIEPGDIIGIDSGLEYLGYETDLKRTAYVLRPGEVEDPAELAAAWQTALGVADIYAREMVPGRIGHEVWASIAAQMRKRGYRTVGPDAGGRAATDVRPEVGIYGHSVGNNSHDIGARIAEDVPFAYGERVRFPIVEGEFVSVEFHVSTPIRAWDGRTWYSRFEENAHVGPRGVEWLVPRQEQLLLIRTEGGLADRR